MKTFWLVKYALSEGITQVTSDAADTEIGCYIRVFGRSWGLYRVGTDLRLTREEAIDAAEKLRLKKVAALKKQLANLEKMNFSGVGGA